MVFTSSTWSPSGCPSLLMKANGRIFHESSYMSGLPSEYRTSVFLASAPNGTEAMIKMSIIILAIFGILSFVYKFVIHSSIVVLG